MATDPDPAYQVYALKYGRQATPIPKSVVYYRYDIYNLPDADLAMDYFTWVIIGGGRCIVVDTGCSQRVAQQRGIDYFGSPLAGLRMLDIDAGDVTDVVISHLHHDHAGTTMDYPNARVYVNEREIAFWTGRALGRAQFRDLVELRDIFGVVQLTHEGRLEHTKDGQQLLPGIRLHLTPGHTPGHQVVEIATPEGSLVLAADAVHFYDQLIENWPHVSFTDMHAVYDSYERLLELARGDLYRIVPGHDPAIAEHAEVIEATDGRLFRIA